MIPNYTSCFHINERMPQGGYGRVSVLDFVVQDMALASKKAYCVNMTAFIYIVNRFYFVNR